MHRNRPFLEHPYPLQGSTTTRAPRSAKQILLLSFISSQFCILCTPTPVTHFSSVYICSPFAEYSINSHLMRPHSRSCHCFSFLLLILTYSGSASTGVLVSFSVVNSTHPRGLRRTIHTYSGRTGGASGGLSVSVTSNYTPSV